MTPRFIALEGGEGAGKTTAISAIAGRLKSHGRDVVVTREPGGTLAGNALRALLLGNDGLVWEAAAEHLLMAAARIQHVEHVIRPAINRGAIVLCDRFIGSTIAYQGAGRGLSESFIRQVHASTTLDLWPDLTLLFDIDPGTGLARSRRRLDRTGSNEARFEDLDLGFHERVRRSFLDQANADADRQIVIDASRSAAEVADAACAAIESVMATEPHY